MEFELEFGADTEVFGDVVIDVLLILMPLPKKFLLYPIEFFSKEWERKSLTLKLSIFWLFWF
jgi:hypothetical protein